MIWIMELLNVLNSKKDIFDLNVVVSFFIVIASVS